MRSKSSLQDIYEVPGLKGEIKDWNMNVFGRINSSRNMLSREVEAWEREEEKKVLTQDKVLARQPSGT